MSDTLIFAVGSVITVMVIAATILMIGRSEAADPAHSRPEDLTSWEREVVKDQRPDVS